MARNGIAKLILRIFVDPQNDIPAGKSRLIKHCKSLLMRNYKREPIASIQSTFFVFGLSRNIYRLLAYQLFTLFNNKYLFGANIYMNIFRCEYIQMRINAEYIQILPLCKTIEKMEKGNNKKSNYLFPSFLPFYPFSRTSALRLMFYL